MSMKKFSFGFGNGTMEMELPAERIIHEIEGRPVTALTDVPAAVKAALRNPIGTPPLVEVVKPGETVAIIVSDITRAWIKASQFLPTLLDELNAAGVADKDIFIVISLGAHRPHTEEEDIQVCGASVGHRVRIYQHNARDKENLTYVGTTSRGVAAWINKRVMDADRIILTGGIVYHLMAGFGAGRKAVMPGISGYETIQGNHRFCLHPQVGSAAVFVYDGLPGGAGLSSRRGCPRARPPSARNPKPSLRHPCRCRTRLRICARSLGRGAVPRRAAREARSIRPPAPR